MKANLILRPLLPLSRVVLLADLQSPITLFRKNQIWKRSQRASLV